MPLAGQSWGKPASGKKWQARLKCNVYYYRGESPARVQIAPIPAPTERPTPEGTSSPSRSELRPPGADRGVWSTPDEARCDVLRLMVCG